MSNTISNELKHKFYNRKLTLMTTKNIYSFGSFRRGCTPLL